METQENCVWVTTFWLSLFFTLAFNFIYCQFL